MYTKDKANLDIEVKGDCVISVGTNSYVRCGRKIVGNKDLHYLLWMTGIQDCMTHEVNDLNDITNRVCQAESGKKTPTACDNYNCQYMWR